MFCTKCGTQLEDDARFCSKCGKPTQRVEIKTVEAKTQNTVIQGDSIEQDVARLRAAKLESHTLTAMMPQSNLSRYEETCQSCGGLAPTKYVELYQNIGVVILRFHKSIKGNLCKTCISKYFWEFTLIDGLFGWWGIISFFVTPFFILNNVGRYIGSLDMEDNRNSMAQPNREALGFHRAVVSRNRSLSRIHISRFHSEGGLVLP